MKIRRAQSAFPVKRKDFVLMQLCTETTETCFKNISTCSVNKHRNTVPVTLVRMCEAVGDSLFAVQLLTFQHFQHII